MRIDELKKSLEAKSLQQYLQYLKSKNNLKIHNGHFSIVLEPPSAKYVYKVWSLDSAWDAWVKVCMAHQDKPFIPKFGKKIYKFENTFIRRTDSHSTINVVKIERLDPLPEQYKSRELYESLWRPLSGHLSNGRPYIALLDNNREKFPELMDFLEKTIPFLTAYLPSNVSMDLHAGNIMMRGDQFVITDPCVISEELITTARISNQMDSAFFLNNYINFASADYVSGKANASIPSKDIVSNNAAIWLQQDKIEKYNLSEDDFPDSLYNNSDIMQSIITYCVGIMRKPLPPTLTKVVLRNTKYSLYYAHALDSNNLEDDDFFMNSFTLPFIDNIGQLYDFIDFFRVADVVMSPGAFRIFLKRWLDIIISGVTNSHGADVFALVIPSLAQINAYDHLDIFLDKISKNIDYDDEHWKSVLSDIPLKRNTPEELKKLFKQ